MTTKATLEALVKQMAEDGGISLYLNNKTIRGEGRTRFEVCETGKLKLRHSPINWAHDYSASELEHAIRFALDYMERVKRNKTQ